MKNKFSELIFQLIPVAIGVYIGIIAGNWNERKAHKKMQQTFIENISKELAGNQVKLKSVLDYHKALGITIDSIFDSGEQEVLNSLLFANDGFQFIDGWAGVKIPNLDKSIYQSGLISNSFNGLKFEKLKMISSIYSYQDSYKELTQPITEKLINSNNSTTLKEVLITLSFLTSDVANMEQGMIEAYDQIIESLE